MEQQQPMDSTTAMPVDRRAPRRARPRPSAWRKVRHGLASAGVLAVAAVWTANVQKPWDAAADAPLALAPVVVEAPGLDEQTEQIARVLTRHAKDDGVAMRAAQALMEQARKLDLEPTLLAGVMLVENSTLNPTAKSFVGAQGLMQVMPFHKGKWSCGSNDLQDVETNVCYGAKILDDFIKRAPNTRTALLRYNGCIRGTNTPNCGRYPNKVLAQKRKFEQQMAALEPRRRG